MLKLYSAVVWIENTFKTRCFYMDRYSDQRTYLIRINLIEKLHPNEDAFHLQIKN